MATKAARCPVCGRDESIGEHRREQRLAGVPCASCGPSMEVDSVVCTVDGERVAIRCTKGGHEYAPMRTYRP